LIFVKRNTPFPLSTLEHHQKRKMMKNYNVNAPVKCTKTILIAATPAQVWAVLTNINAWPQWQTEIPKAQLQGPLASGSTFTWKTGGATIHSILHTVEANQAFGWTGKTIGATAIHNWLLKEINGKTEVAVQESMDGWLTKLLKKAFNKNLEKGMTKWLELLKTEVERRK
jgi:uncharacterized protein YndB with AHSA1/START domain